MKILPLLLLAASAAASEPSGPDRIAALERRVQELEALVRAMQPKPAPAPPPAPVEVEKRLATLEEKIERRESHALAFDKIHLHGYGEVHYNNPKTQSTVGSHRTLNAETDVHRMVLGAGYEFTESIRMDFEGEWEHAGGTMEVEYAFLEMDLKPGLSFRAGSLLVPFGPLNEIHEPTNFYSVERPYVETYLVPSTWMEVGAGLAGRSPDGRHAFRGYVVTGLAGSGFTDDGGIRGGRSKGNQGAADDLALVARYETTALPVEGLRLGLSGYHGEADQGNAAFRNVGVSMAQADVRYRRRALEFLGSGVVTAITHADDLSAAKRETIGDRQEGFYAELAWHIGFPEDREKETDREIVPFLRFEELDTHASVPGGFIQGRENQRRIWTTGLAFFPTRDRNVVIKADVEAWRDGLNENGTRYNLGVGFTF